MKLFKLIIAFSFLYFSLNGLCADIDKSNVKPDDKFFIEFVNAPKGEIVIGGKSKYKHDIFYAKQHIKWKSKKHWIEVRNTRTNIFYRFSGGSYNETGASSLNDYIMLKYRMTADKGPSGLDKKVEATGEFLGRYVWDIINDELYIPVQLPLDDNSVIVLTAIPGGAKITADYDDESNEIIISSDMFTSNGIDISKIAQYVFYVEYIHDNVSEPLTNQFRLRYIPYN